jgi:hypothetical protein
VRFDRELMLCHHDAVRGMEEAVFVDIETGAVLARVDTGSPVQSVVFHAPGFGRDVYYCSFTTVAHLEVS